MRAGDGLFARAGRSPRAGSPSRWNISDFAVSPSESTASGGETPRTLAAHQAPLTWRAQMRQFLDTPDSGPWARLFAFVMLVLILLNSVLLCLSTLPRYLGGWMDETEVVFNIIFTIELLVRLVPLEKVWEFDVYLSFDVLAIVPGWLILLSKEEGAGNDVVRVMKALRTLRLLKLARQYDGSHRDLPRDARVDLRRCACPSSSSRCRDGLLEFLYYLELEAAGRENSVFESIPQAIWYMLAPLTTNGFEAEPTSGAGCFVTIGAMFFGVLFLSMPLAIVGSNFTSIWDDRERVVFIEKVKEHFFGHHFTRENIVAAFDEMDLDHSGSISFKELRVALLRMGIHMSPQSLRQLWRAIDTDLSGEISTEEFVRLFFEDRGAQHRGSSHHRPSRAPSRARARATRRRRPTSSR